VSEEEEIVRRPARSLNIRRAPKTTGEEKMAREPKEWSKSENLLAVGFVIMVFAALWLSVTGVISSPLTAGFVVISVTALVFLGDYLKRINAIPAQAIWLWYLFSLGLVLIFYGAVAKGYIPLVVSYGASIEEEALSSSLIYLLAIAAVFAAVLAVAAAARKTGLAERLRR